MTVTTHPILGHAFTGPVTPGTDDSLLVAHAVTAADLGVALRAAVRSGLPLTVRGAGHGQLRSAAGRIVLDTSHLSDVQIFADRRIASIGPGARWREVMQAAAPYGLAPLCGNAVDVGVAGFTLGGGVGWLSRQYGYTADNVFRVEAVLADSTPVTATADTEPELFWGMRGAGANLALVTRLEVGLAPVSEVVAGEVEYPWEQAEQVLTAFAGQAPPDHLTSIVLLDHRDTTRPPMVTVQAMSTTGGRTARDALAGVLPMSGRPVRDTIAAMPYREGATLGGTFPAGFELLDGLGREAVGRLLAAVTIDRPVRLEIRYWGGAPSRPDGRTGPAGHRGVPFSVTVDGPPDVVADVAALGTGGSFLNFLRDTGRTESAYTPADYARIRRLKAEVDPDNIFGSQHNIPPAVPGQVF
jgi:FAD/FMN-containing dehydrogenase